MRNLSVGEIRDVTGGGFLEGLAIVASAIVVVALAPEEIAIGSVAGIGSLVVEGCGAGIMLSK